MTNANSIPIRVDSDDVNGDVLVIVNDILFVFLVYENYLFVAKGMSNTPKTMNQTETRGTVQPDTQL
jgi:hypothetical protein